MNISKRAQKPKNFNVNFLEKYNVRVGTNAYHKMNNPEGIINLKTAENQLIEDIIHEKMNEAKSFKFQPWMQYYFDSFGVESFRAALAKFFGKHFKAADKINPLNIAVTLGCRAALDLLFYLITDPRDCVLMTAPFFCPFESYLFRDDIKFFYVFPPSEDFLVTSKELQDALAEATAQGFNVKAVMTTNPDNPTGRSRDRKSLEDILEFANRHNLHAVINESYALSSFKDDDPFCSVLSVPNIPQPEKTHMLWGFSRDLGMSGLRCGVIHTKIDLNPHKTLFFMKAPPAIVQDTLAKLINDEKWLDEVYFPSNWSRMKDAYYKTCHALRLMGVEPFEHYSSGFFVWADFTKIMKKNTKEEEPKLFEIIFAQGAYIVPGQVFYCPFPGWFRIIFTYEPDYTQIGLERIKKAISIYRKETI